jgi:hypothetical protein
MHCAITILVLQRRSHCIPYCAADYCALYDVLYCDVCCVRPMSAPCPSALRPPPVRRDYKVLCCAVLYCTVVYFSVSVLYCTVLCCAILLLYFTVLYYVLYCTILCCTLLCCTVLVLYLYCTCTCTVVCGHGADMRRTWGGWGADWCADRRRTLGGFCSKRTHGGHRADTGETGVRHWCGRRQTRGRHGADVASGGHGADRGRGTNRGRTADIGRTKRPQSNNGADMEPT